MESGKSLWLLGHIICPVFDTVPGQKYMANVCVYCTSSWYLIIVSVYCTWSQQLSNV